MEHTQTQHDTTYDPDYHFTPQSAIWQINRERVLLLTGIKVLLMQIAHPLVAESVYAHSYVFDKPIKRLHRTLTLTLGMVFGTRTEVQPAINAIDAAHRPAVGRTEQATGQHPAGTVYNPRNPYQALWVFATLVEGAVSGYETLVAPLNDERKQAMLDDSRLIASWMGIPAQVVPDTYQGLLDYMQDAIESEIVIVGEKARQIAPFVSTQSIPIVKWFSYFPVQANIALLPETIRTQYGYTLSTREQQLAERAFALSRWLVPRLPDWVRFAPEYQRAIKSFPAG
ncbi:MAG: oxygenase MpaB family protein [Chloroflexota bacterium]